MKEKEVGNLGEDIAVQYLESIGYEILERNYTVKGGEIDIIATFEKLLVFVEVKTRNGSDFPGAQAVDERKCTFLVSAAERFVLEKSELASEMESRFDLIDICFSGDGTTNVKHGKNIIF